MALNQSTELKNNVFGVQPNANDSTEENTPGDIRTRIAKELAIYGAWHEEIADIFANIYDRADRIVRLAERESDTTAGQLHQLRIEVMANQAIERIHEGMTAREAQQMTYVSGLMGLPGSDTPSSDIIAPDALAA